MRKIPLVLAGVAAAVTPVVLAAPGPEPAMPDGPAGRPGRAIGPGRVGRPADQGRCCESGGQVVG